MKKEDNQNMLIYIYTHTRILLLCLISLLLHQKLGFCLSDITLIQQMLNEYQLGSWKQRLKSRMLYLEGQDQIKFCKYFILKGNIRKSLGKDS